MNLTVEDLHKIREENYEITKNMSRQEMIDYTNKKAAPVAARLHSLRLIDNPIIENAVKMFDTIMFGLGISDPRILTFDDFIKAYAEALGEVPKSVFKGVNALLEHGYTVTQVSKDVGVSVDVINGLGTKQTTK